MSQSSVSTRGARVALAIFSAIGLALLLLIAMLALPASPLRIGLRCARATAQCALEQQFRVETRRQPFALANLTAADVIYTHGLHGGGRSSVFLRVGEQRYFLTSYSFARDANAASAEINDFIADKTKAELSFSDDSRGMNTLAWISLVVVALGIVGMFVYGWRRLSSR